MQGIDRRLPTRPLLLLLQAGIRPLWQRWRLFEGGVEGLVPDPAGQSLCQRVDRLSPGDAVDLFGRDHVVRMGHLPVAVEPGELAGDDTIRPRRQLTLQPGAAGIEEHQLHRNIAGKRVDAVGCLGVARRGVLQNQQRQGYQLILIEVTGRVDPGALLHPMGLSPQDVPQVRSRDPLDQHGRLRADPRQVSHRCKQGIEDCWPHASFPDSENRLSGTLEPAWITSNGASVRSGGQGIAVRGNWIC